LHIQEYARAKEVISFFQHLEMLLCAKSFTRCASATTSPTAPTSTCAPHANGDLCERYTALSCTKQKELADDVDR
jgi:hypothetical protein